MGHLWHRFAWLFAPAVLALAQGCGEAPPGALSEHEIRNITAQLVTAPEELDPEQVTQLLQGSVHQDLDCSDCHAPGTPESKAFDTNGVRLGQARCASCHESEANAYDQSIHGSLSSQNNTGAARCVSCHGAHDILATDDPRSPVNRRNLPQTCGKCHKNPELARRLGIKKPDAETDYLESVHGRLLVGHGLVAAPSCVDCHGRGHLIFRAADARSTVNRRNQSRTCGQCHQGDAADYAEGIHGQKLAQGNTKAPACADCHTSHRIAEPGAGFKLASDRLCGQCHLDRLGQYLQTYHGRAHDLGSENVAACYDCHGSHDIRPVADPRSTLSSANRLSTCRKCHADAPPRFTAFMAHGDYSDRQHYPMLFWAFVIMTSLIVGTFAVWGLHTLLWVARTLIVYVRAPAAFREHKRRARDESTGKLYQRFRPVDRFCHFLIITSFMILVSTGMPLKFHSSPWSQAIFDLLGGAHVAAKLHRFGAIISLLYLLIHVSSLIGPLRRRWSSFRDSEGKLRIRALLGFVFGPDSPLPNLDDLRDVRNHTRWFFGRGPKPKFDKFTYWEKFDYFAELWGSAFIGISGLVMWFPTQISRVLPGWVVNLAQVIHSQEALLAAGFILTFHFFNSHFRLEKFPLDTVMFSGRITEEELKHERARQYERFAAQDRLHELEVKDDWSQWKYLFNTFGITALLVGLMLAAVIFVGLTRLWFGG
jgi:cytochrome b subunit of formate dehydrogenase